MTTKRLIVPALVAGAIMTGFLAAGCQKDGAPTAEPKATSAAQESAPAAQSPESEHPTKAEHPSKAEAAPKPEHPSSEHPN